MTLLMLNIMIIEVDSAGVHGSPFRFSVLYLGSSHVLSVFLLAGCWVEDDVVYGLD